MTMRSKSQDLVIRSFSVDGIIPVVIVVLPIKSRGNENNDISGSDLLFLASIYYRQYVYNHNVHLLRSHLALAEGFAGDHGQNAQEFSGSLFP